MHLEFQHGLLYAVPVSRLFIPTVFMRRYKARRFVKVRPLEIGLARFRIAQPSWHFRGVLTLSLLLRYCFHPHPPWAPKRPSAKAAWALKRRGAKAAWCRSAVSRRWNPIKQKGHHPLR
jgi:hypothetical protein